MQNDLSLEIRRPIWGSNALELSLGMGEIDGYNQEQDAQIGYNNASFQLSGDQPLLEQWLDRIGFEVTTFNPGLDTIWQGFINEMELRIGGVVVRRGPLIDITNKAKVIYQTITYNTNPPIGGEQAETAFASDTTSQTLYGVLETAVSGGSGSSTAMEQLRDTFLAEKARPATNNELNLESQSSPGVTINCLGYGHLLGHFYYSRSGTGEINASARITHILSSHPSIAFDTTGVVSNTLQVPLYGKGDKSGLEEIADVVAKGDASDNRWLFGVFDDQRAVYKAAPTTILYEHELGAERQQVEDADTGGRVMPWDVRAGEWLFIRDLLPGLGKPTNLREDPRAIFIESARYTMPWGLQISGSKTGKLAQKLAKLGLGGI